MDASEYDAIEAAFRETERGRWFLVEHGRRNRGADTDTLLQAIARLESAVVTERETEGVGRLRGDLMEMAEAIARTKAEIAALSAPEQDQSRLTLASEALDAIVRATERATSDILGAAEAVQETAWTLREQGIDLALCDELDRHATLIYTACSFQDLTAQRTSRIVHTLRYLEERIASMIGIWGARIDEIPAAPDGETARIPTVPVPLDQTDVDRFLDMDANATMPEPSPVAARRAAGANLSFVSDDIGWAEPEAEAVAAPDVEAGAAFAEPDADADAGEAIEFEAQVIDAQVIDAQVIEAQVIEAHEIETIAIEEPEVEAAVIHADMVEPVAIDAMPAVSASEAVDAPVGASVEEASDAVAAASPDMREPVDESPATVAAIEAASEQPSAAADAKPAKRATQKRAPKAQAGDLSIAFDDLDRLSIEEKIALFS